MPPSQPRNRKVAILTPQGFQKLQTAISQSKYWNPYTQTYSLEALSEQTGLSPQTLSKVHARQSNVDLRTLTRYFSAFNLTLDTLDYSVSPQTDRTLKPFPGLPSSEPQGSPSFVPNPIISWGIAPDVSVFYGRTNELTTLHDWVLQQRCRLVILIGMGGIGKTWLATRFAEQIQHQFQAVIWHSLQPLPPSPPTCNHFIEELIHQLTPEPDRPLPDTTLAKISFLLDCLNQTRCLLVLDNLESILPGYCPSSMTETRRAIADPSSWSEYEVLFQALSRGRHQSCVVLTSREAPQRIQHWSGESLPIRVLPLRGLQLTEVQQMFQARGNFQGDLTEWSQLVAYYSGNPLILEMAATVIQQVFDGNLTAFLSHRTLMFDEIQELLDQQFDGLTNPAEAIIQVLAKQDTPIDFAQLRSHLSPTISTTVLLASLKSMKARSLLERITAYFSLIPLLKDYIRARHSTQQIVTYAVGDRVSM